VRSLPYSNLWPERSALHKRIHVTLATALAAWEEWRLQLSAPAFCSGRPNAARTVTAEVRPRHLNSSRRNSLLTTSLGRTHALRSRCQPPNAFDAGIENANLQIVAAPQIVGGKISLTVNPRSVHLLVIGRASSPRSKVLLRHHMQSTIGKYP
jgi:hypothetical protein